MQNSDWFDPLTWKGQLFVAFSVSLWHIFYKPKRYKGEFMEKVFASGSIGTHGTYEIGLTKGKVYAKMSYSSDEIGGSGEFEIKTRAGLKVLEGLIPGSIDDAAIEIIANALDL